MIRAVLLGALTLAMAPYLAPPQGRPLPANTDFSRLFEEYRRGDAAAAIEAFARWPEKRVTLEAELPPGLDDASTLAALALFHTETAMRSLKFGEFAEGTPIFLNLGFWGLEKVFEPRSYRAYTIIDQLLKRAKAEDDARLLSFVRNWYIAAISHCFRWRHGACMQSLLEKSESDLGHDDVEWLLLYGSINEPNGLTRARAKRIAYKSLFRMSIKPTWAFRRALDRRPDLVEARLRWGHTLYVLLNDPRAIPELERALVDAQRIGHLFTVHLAAMFLGEIHEEADRTDRALSYYRLSADTLRAHTASVALGQLLVRSGQRDEGWEIGRLMFGREGPRVDPIVDPYPLYRAAQYWQNASRLSAMREMVRIR